MMPSAPAVAAFPRPLGLVLSGGGAIGGAQVGHLLALRDLGIVQDVIVGTSVGAINGAVVAADPDLGAERLAAIWSRVRREDIFPLRPLRLLASLAAQPAGLLPASGLVRFVTAHLAECDLDNLRVPLHVIATDAQTGELVDLTTGPLLDALVASSAIPGVFPPVRLGERTLLDGGLVADIPVERAFDLGVRSAIILDASGPCEITRPPRTVIESMAWALRVLTRSQADAHVHASSLRGLVIHLPTPCTARHSVLDFRGVDDLIRTTRRLTLDFFAARADEPWPALGMVGRQHRHTADHVCLATA